MSTILVKEIERSRSKTVGLNHVSVPRQATFVAAKKSAASPWEAAHESQSLLTVSLLQSRLLRRSRKSAILLLESQSRAS